MKLRFPIGSRGVLLAVGLGIGGMACVAPAAVAANPEGPFIALNDTAMDKMMADMAVRPTGDADHDFVAMMVPHHRGAIDMAQAELKYGQNSHLKTIAQEIIVDQMQEITLMRLALGEPLPQSVPSPTEAVSVAKQTSPTHESDAKQTQMKMSAAMQMAPTRPTGTR
jgi:hypothetical protein